MSDQVKVLLQEGDRVETLWADALGGHRYRLDNSPFWAYGVSWDDIVEAFPDPDGILRMERVLEKSGNRTIRLYFEAAAADTFEAKAALQAVNELGATYEGMNPRYLALNIPPTVDLNHVVDALTQSGIQWEHADPTYESLHPDAPLSNEEL